MLREGFGMMQLPLSRRIHIPVGHPRKLTVHWALSGCSALFLWFIVNAHLRGIDAYSRLKKTVTQYCPTDSQGFTAESEGGQNQLPTHGHALLDCGLEDSTMNNRFPGCASPAARNTRSTFLSISWAVHAAFSVPGVMNHCDGLQVPLEQTVHKFPNCCFIQNGMSYMYYELCTSWNLATKIISFYPHSVGENVEILWGYEMCWSHSSYLAGILNLGFWIRSSSAS